MLEEAPEPEAKMLFEHLLAEGAGPADGRALRTFQRRVVVWLWRQFGSVFIRAQLRDAV